MHSAGAPGCRHSWRIFPGVMLQERVLIPCPPADQALSEERIPEAVRGSIPRRGGPVPKRRHQPCAVQPEAQSLIAHAARFAVSRVFSRPRRSASLNDTPRCGRRAGAICNLRHDRDGVSAQIIGLPLGDLSTAAMQHPFSGAVIRIGLAFIDPKRGDLSRADLCRTAPQSPPRSAKTIRWPMRRPVIWAYTHKYRAFRGVADMCVQHRAVSLFRYEPGRLPCV